MQVKQKWENGGMKMLQIKQDNERAKFAFEKVNKIKKMCTLMKIIKKTFFH